MTGATVCSTFSGPPWSPGCRVEAVRAGVWGLWLLHLPWESEGTLASGPRAPLWNESFVPGSVHCFIVLGPFLWSERPCADARGVGPWRGRRGGSLGAFPRDRAIGWERWVAHPP